MNKLKKSKVVIVLGSNIHWAPYYYRYEKMLKNINTKFDLIIWNRELINEKISANYVYDYRLKDTSNNKNPFKIIKFFKFCKYVKKILKNNEYEKIVFLGTHGCAPVFLYRFLKKNFNRKYWLDIRDYQYEWFKPYYLMEKQSIINSFATVLSSKGYKEFLPTYDYHYIHNIDPNMGELIKKLNIKKSDKIRISFIGNIRYFDECIKLLELFKNDDRFIMQFYGAGSDSVKSYCIENKISNVDFYGKFEQDDTIDFYNKTDIINNVYGNSNRGLTTALSNKLYYSIYFKIPILVCKNTYMEKISKDYNFGFVVDDDKEYPDKLYESYIKYKSNVKNAKYDIIKKDIEEEEESTIRLFNSFIE